MTSEGLMKRICQQLKQKCRGVDINGRCARQEAEGGYLIHNGGSLFGDMPKSIRVRESLHATKQVKIFSGNDIFIK